MRNRISLHKILFYSQLTCNCPERRKSTICRRIGHKDQQVSAVKGVRTRAEAQQHQVNVREPRSRVHLLSGRPPRGVALPLSLSRDCEASHVRLKHTLFHGEVLMCFHARKLRPKLLLLWLFVCLFRFYFVCWFSFGELRYI